MRRLTFRWGEVKLGDVVEKLASPIGKAIGLKCFDKDGKLKPESRCAKRRDKLNALTKS